MHETLFSKPKEEYQTNIEKKYFVTSVTTIISININNFEYDWKLSEMYFDGKTQFSNQFITDHSGILQKKMIIFLP